MNLHFYGINSGHDLTWLSETLVSCEPNEERQDGTMYWGSGPTGCTWGTRLSFIVHDYGVVDNEDYDAIDRIYNEYYSRVKLVDSPMVLHKVSFDTFLPNGFLMPDGRFIKCSFMQHRDLAKDILRIEFEDDDTGTFWYNRLLDKGILYISSVFIDYGDNDNANTDEQVEKISGLLNTASGTALKIIKNYLNRWKLSESELRDEMR